MKKGNFSDITPMCFPAGRRTRVMIGQNGLINGSHFCQGYVEIDKDGSIPVHDHETVESYTILEGKGIFTLEGESVLLSKGDFVFIDSYQKHGLRNTGEGKLIVMFVYSPQIVVDHWEKEKEGILK